MLLLVGLDGASPELVERLAAQGRLPTLRGLMRHGVYGRLQSSVNCSPISAWSSLLTGVNPGKHGVWSLNTIIPGTYDFAPPHARMLRAPTLSQLLTERGLEVGTLFVPMTFPAREAEWSTVAGWLCPSIEVEGFAWPARLLDMARRALGDIPLDVDLSGLVAAGRYDAAFELAARALRTKCDFALEVLADRHWDMLAVNFVETDRLQRWCWHLIDRAHPAYRPEVSARYGGSIEQIYVEADRALARLAAALQPQDQLLVLSTYGMGVRTGASTCVPGALELLGLLQHYGPAGDAWHRLGRLLSAGAGGLWHLIRRLLPGPLARRLPRSDSSGERASRVERVTGIDYERSIFLPTPGGHIVINLVGEFPRGHLSPEVAARYVDEIARALASAIDPANGRQPLEALLRREQVCSGPYLNRIPHLITRWRPGSVVSGLALTGRDGHVHVVPAHHRHMSSAAPTSQGILVAAGAGLRRSVRVEGARLEDVTATVLHLCGQPIPTYFDGRVLHQCLQPAFLQELPVRRVERDLPKIIDDPARAEQLSSVVREHLIARGYTD